MKRILTATDGSQHARKALEFAAELARRFDAELLVTHVVSTTQPSEEDRHLIEMEYGSELANRMKQLQSQNASDPGTVPQLDMSAYVETAAIVQDLLGERLLASSEEYVRELGAMRVHTVLAHGDPAKMILSIADENHVDAIVVASRGLGEIRALLLGSVSTKIAHMAHCSVVLVR